MQKAVESPRLILRLRERNGLKWRKPIASAVLT